MSSKYQSLNQPQGMAEEPSMEMFLARNQHRRRLLKAVFLGMALTVLFMMMFCSGGKDMKVATTTTTTTTGVAPNLRVEENQQVVVEEKEGEPNVVFLSDGYLCPGSPAYVMHASCKVDVKLASKCADVGEEMKARVAGQFQTWHDPKHNGTYTFEGEEKMADGTKLSFSRLTGDKKYTDKMIFYLVDENGQCHARGCSESQVTSFADFSTNYCEMRNLYCGSSDKCKPVKHDFANQEVAVHPSAGAGTDRKACIAE